MAKHFRVFELSNDLGPQSGDSPEEVEKRINQIKLASLARTHSKLFCGTSKGAVLVIDNIEGFIDKAAMRKVLVKCNRIHGQSPVVQMFFSDKQLLSLSLEDQSVVLSDIRRVNKKTEPYFFLKDHLKTVFEKLYARKYEIAALEPDQSQLTNSDSMRSLKFLKLVRQLGKKRSSTSQSLLYLPRSQLVSIVGKKIIFYFRRQTPEGDNYFQSRECVFLDESLPNLKREEIACVSISLNRQLFAIAYKTQHCLTTVWDFDGKGLLGSRQLGPRLVTQDMTFTENSQHLVCLLFKQSGCQELVVLKLATMAVLNRLRFDHWLSFKIRGLYTIESQRFYTFGFQHLYLWTFSENMLDFEILNLESFEEQKKNYVDIHNSEEYFRKNKNFKLVRENNGDLEISFFSTITTMKMIKSLLVTATDDGYILFWVRNQLVKRHLGHTDSAIKAIDFCIFDENCSLTRPVHIGRLQRDRQPVEAQVQALQAAGHHRAALQLRSEGLQPGTRLRRGPRPDQYRFPPVQ